MKAFILAHIGEIGCDKSNARSTELFCGRGQKDQRQELFVRPVECADDDNIASADIRIDSDKRFAVRKPSDFALAKLGTNGLGQVAGQRVIAWHREYERAHLSSPSRIASGCERANSRA